MKYLGLSFLLVLIIGGGFVYWNYFFVYSDGYREGVLNKFSTKGTIFKTHEGELLMPGVVPTMNQLSNNFFYFSSTDHKVTEQLNAAIGKKIKVHYIQYNSSLPWRGDSYADKNKETGQYIVDKIVLEP
jgi:hypothetical protein